jgi:hypothetical protein
MGRSDRIRVNSGVETTVRVMVIAISPNTVTYDNLSRGGRATESLGAFTASFAASWAPSRGRARRRCGAGWGVIPRPVLRQVGDAEHQQRGTPLRCLSRDRREPRFLIGADRAGVGRVRVGHNHGSAFAEQAVYVNPDEGGAVASADHVGIADELVDAA